MEAYQTAFEEVLHGEAPAPSVVIGIADNESGEHEKEIYGQIAVIEIFYHGVAGKSITFEYMIPHNDEGGYATKAV
ncbi:hypothetical protein EV202_12924 [Bacteroides heparinolyticus]|uniref:Uncharacterized protein n=1 Tax=Prevotella heparinolytica TaxID=28113 RepID=A0A4R2LMW5_9BACE|nr:hypothetical protein EV202_12924 [Bacteroides heparinolyticus]